MVSDATWRRVEARLPFLDYLSAEDRVALRAQALAFAARKVFWGAHGFEPDTEVRLSIALQACLLVLKLGVKAYDGWRGIIVYPGEFAVPRRLMDPDGVLHEYVDEALGESWEGGPVVLAWFDDMADYAGANVVIHEFAHKLDMLDGEADGVPPLHAGMRYEAWQAAFEPAYADFRAQVEAGKTGYIDPYAAEHPAEFFAVLSEVFFTRPALLHVRYPAVYRQLAAFYRQDPGNRLGAQIQGPSAE